MNTKVFISYSHDNDIHKNWVRSFADRLIGDGIDVVLDQYDLKLGDMTPQFMEKSISESDFLVVCITPNYVEKANDRNGGVGYETHLATGELSINGNHRKYIPLFIQMDFSNAPSYLKGANGIKIVNIFSYDKEYTELYKTLTGQTLQKPTLGIVKSLQSVTEVKQINIEPLLERKRHDKYVLCDAIINIPSFAKMVLHEYFEILKTKRDFKGKYFKPYIFQDHNKKSHNPQIVYESGDYFRQFSNWSLYDKLVFEDNIIRYTMAECREDKHFLITGSLFLGSVISIIDFLKGALIELNMDQIIEMTVIIESNTKMSFRIPSEAMRFEQEILEMYCLDNGKHSINYSFKALEVKDIQMFTNRFLGQFSSDNPKSYCPFLSVSFEEMNKFINIVRTEEHYLAY